MSPFFYGYFCKLLEKPNARKRIGDANVIDHFACVHVLCPAHAASCCLGAGNYNCIKERKIARLV
jgi:hypothetical protein